MSLTLTPRSPHKLFDKAMRSHQAGMLVEATELLETLVKHFPKHLDGNFMLGSLLAQSNRTAEARRYLERAAELNPRSPQVQNNLGNVHRMQGNDEGALKCYHRVVRLDPEFTSAWLNLGFICTKLKRWQEALDHFSTVGADRSNDVDVLCAIGEAHAAVGNTVAAIDCYERALLSDSDGRRNVSIILAALRGGELPARHSDALVLETYRKKAADWDTDILREKDSYFGPEHVRRLLAPYIKPTPPLSPAILDLGCGTGVCGDFLAPAARSLTGVDLSPEMLAIARSKGIYTHLAEAEIGSYLDSTRENHDLIVAAGVLIMFSKLDVIFRQVASRMTPGGLFALTLYRSATEPIEIRHNYHFGHSRSYIQQEVVAAGLEVLELSDVVHEIDGGLEQPGFAILLKKPGCGAAVS